MNSKVVVKCRSFSIRPDPTSVQVLLHDDTAFVLHFRVARKEAVKIAYKIRDKVGFSVDGVLIGPIPEDFGGGRYFSRTIDDRCVVAVLDPNLVWMLFGELEGAGVT